MKSKEYWDAHFEERYKKRRDKWGKLHLKVRFFFLNKTFKAEPLIYKISVLTIAIPFLISRLRNLSCLPWN